jgi:hypothetical protein
MFTFSIDTFYARRTPGKLASIELQFDQELAVICHACHGRSSVEGEVCEHCSGNGIYPFPFTGMKLTGFEVWERDGVRTVKFPKALAAIADPGPVNELRDEILDAYAEIEKAMRESQ